MTAAHGCVPAGSTTEYTGEIVGRLRNVLGTDLVGVYLHGSLVLGDFSEARSDVDAVAVATRSLSSEERREIAERLSQQSLPCPARGLEFHVLREDALTPVAVPSFELHVATSAQGEPERVIDGRGRAGDRDLVMHFAVLRERGRALFGPRPDRLFPRVPRTLLLCAFLHELEWAREHASPSYQVLNACRAWRYLDEGVICAQTAGGEWARERVRDTSPIDGALRHRRGLTETHPDPDSAAALLANVARRLEEGEGVHERRGGDH